MNIYQSTTVTINNQTYYIGLRQIKTESGFSHRKIEIVNADKGKMIDGEEADTICQQILTEAGVDDPKLLDDETAQVYYRFASFAESD